MSDETVTTAPTERKNAMVEQPTSNLNTDSTSSFRDRALNRLETESRPEPETTPDVSTEEQNTDAHQPEESYPEDSDKVKEKFEQPDGKLSDGVEDSDVEDQPWYDGLEPSELGKRVTEAEERHDLMQRDYTQKTQKLGESRKELLTSLDQAQRIAAVYAERASAQLKRYENVNWQQLQSTLDPQVYNQRLAEYKQVVGIRDRAVTEHGQIKQFADQQVEKARTDQAEISRDILRTTMPGWGNELYGSLREFAVNSLDFSSEEFDDITDHRIIRLIHRDWNISNTGKTVQQIQQGNQPKPPGGANKERPRGADGRFKNAHQAHLNNPGNRDLTRTSFRERLRKERTGR